MDLVGLFFPHGQEVSRSSEFRRRLEKNSKRKARLLSGKLSEQSPPVSCCRRCSATRLCRSNWNEPKLMPLRKLLSYSPPALQQDAGTGNSPAR